MRLLEIGKSRFGKMYLNILITLFLLGLCLGQKKETASSIRLHRDDVPLPYKYQPLYDYSLEKSRKYKDQPVDYFRSRPNILKNIQYAPLNPEDEVYPLDRDTKILKSKVHLEPKIIEKSANDSQVSQTNFLNYIEGHNIVVPLKRFKDDGYEHDVFSEKNKEIDQIEYDMTLEQDSTEPKRDVASLKAVTIASAHSDFNYQQSSPREYNPTKTYLSALENSQIEPVFNPHVKVPRLHLNIARTYNFARIPLKASLMGYEKLIMNNPKQTYVPNIDFLLQEKTFLYPVDNNKYSLRT